MASVSTQYQHYKLYIETNRYFIEEKMKQMFREELQEYYPNTRVVSWTKLEKLIKQIMAFEANPELKPFFASLQINIAKFCQEAKPLQIDTILEMINFCLDNTVIESTKQEDSKENTEENQNEQKGQEQTHQNQEQLETPSKVQQIKVDLSGVFQKNIQQYQDLLKNPNLSKDERFVLESSLSNLRLQQMSIKGNRNKRTSYKFEQNAGETELDMPRPPPPSNKQILIKKLKPLFAFACQQQQNIGTNTTFDRIYSQCNHLNLGKFLIFCSTLKIPNSKLTRFVLIEKFKKVAEGFQQIDFEKLVKLLQLLSQVDPTIYQRIHVDDKTQKPPRPKSIRSPFSIKDKEFFRDIQHANSARKQLTSHSGKMGYSLKEQLQNRKLLKSRTRYGGQSTDQQLAVGTVILNRSFLSPGSYLGEKVLQTIQTSQPSQLKSIKKADKNIFTLEHLKNVANELEMKRLSRLIVQDDEDEFLESYELEEMRIRRPNNIAQSIRKRASEVSRLEQTRTIQLKNGQFAPAKVGKLK